MDKNFVLEKKTFVKIKKIKYAAINPIIFDPRLFYREKNYETMAQKYKLILQLILHSG